MLGTPSGGAGLRPRGFSESLVDYIGHFTELGGKLEVCSSCFEEYCRDLPKDASGRVALRAAPPGHAVTVTADDRAFPEDIQAWCRKTCHELVSLETKAGFYEAVVKKP